MAIQQDPKARERAGGDDRDVGDIETEIDEALEDVDDEEIDESLDEALDKADEADGDEVLIELEDDDEADDTGGRGGKSGAGRN